MKQVWGAPNAAATANVTHPVKQGFIQTLGVFTDTLLIVVVQHLSFFYQMCIMQLI